jgi:hypothetical protein
MSAQELSVLKATLLQPNSSNDIWMRSDLVGKADRSRAFPGGHLTPDLARRAAPDITLPLLCRPLPLHAGVSKIPRKAAVSLGNPSNSMLSDQKVAGSSPAGGARPVDDLGDPKRGRTAAAASNVVTRSFLRAVLREFTTRVRHAPGSKAQAGRGGCPTSDSWRNRCRNPCPPCHTSSGVCSRRYAGFPKRRGRSL